MKRFFYLCSGILVLTLSPASIERCDQHILVEGTVFYDGDADGRMGKGESGISSVAVSDGFSVALTDEYGHYSLELSPRARFVTVYTPSGYHSTGGFFTDVRALVSGQKTSGKCLHRGCEGFDFGLVAAEESGSFAQMGDIEERTYSDWIDRLKDYSAATADDFIVITGDICYADGLVRMSQAINDRTMGRRTVFTIGNHDLIKGNVDYAGNPYGEKNFEDCFGPSWYAFGVAGVQFIVTPMMSGDAQPSYSVDDIQNWLKAYMEVLPPDTPMVIFNHDANEKVIPSGADVKAFVYGHRHTQYRTVSRSGIPFYCTMSYGKAGNDHSPAALRRLFFSTEGISSTSLRYTPLSNHIVPHIVSTGGRKVLSAVVYDAAAEVDHVFAALPDGSTLYLLRENDFMWQASLPEDIPDGNCSVTAEFSDGGRASAFALEEPALKWASTISAKPYLCNPVLSGEHIYIATIDNENGEGCGIYALSAKDGSREWFFHSDNSIQGDIALSGGVIYAGDTDYNIYALNASDGTLRWRKRIAETFYPSLTEGVSVEDGIVYCGTGIHLKALSARDGSVVWANSHNHDSITNVCTNQVADGALLTNGYWVGRFCYDRKTGELLWEKRDYQNRYSTCTPTVVDTTFIYTGYNSLSQVAARSGEVLKYNEFETVINVKSEPLVTGDKVIFGTSRDGLMAVNLSDFSQAWTYQCKPALIYTSPYTCNSERTIESSPVAYGDCVLFGANDGCVYCLEQAGGKFVWRINIGLPVLGRPVIKGHDLLLFDFAGNLYCYDLRELADGSN